MGDESQIVRVRYESNNSGGSWWLSDEDWKALEAAGWKVDWYKDDTGPFRKGDRWLGALASKAYCLTTSRESAISAWEEITGGNADDSGCSCCGVPHRFYEEPADDLEYLAHVVLLKPENSQNSKERK